jgi:hypothetical protein
MILFLVVSFLVLMSIVVAGLFNRSISTSLTAVSQTKKEKADLLARGLWWKAYSNKNAGGANLANSFEVIDGIRYDYTYNYGPGGQVTINVIYP